MAEQRSRAGKLVRVAYRPPRDEPAVFFACRTRNEERYWRMVSQSGAILHCEYLLIVRLIDPHVTAKIKMCKNVSLFSDTKMANFHLGVDTSGNLSPELPASYTYPAIYIYGT